MLKASVRKVSFTFAVMSNSFDAVIFQSKYAGALNANCCRLPTSPGCGLQKPPETAGVHPPSCGEEGAHVSADLAVGKGCNRSVGNGTEAAPVKGRVLRHDRERRAALPGEDRAGLPSVDQQAQCTIRRAKELVALAHRQLISKVGLERMRQVEWRA